LAKFSPEVVRFFLLSTHYRSPLDFDDENLASAGKGLERIKTSIRLLSEALERKVFVATNQSASGWAADLINSLEKLKASFETAMDDDFNTALAMGVIFDLAREVNTAVREVDTAIHAGSELTGADREALRRAMDLFRDFNGVMGLFKVDQESGRILFDSDGSDGSSLSEGLINLIIEIRQEARKKKDWGTADRIRDGLKELGLILEDTPQGVRWKKQ
jgi:cysteinyl-tRNA synthetase